MLRLQAVAVPDGDHVRPILDAAFREFGAPKVMRSDNGPPFASVGVGGLSRLSVRLIKVGVMPERIAPGKPRQNGRHERLHRTVKEDTASPPAADARAQQRRFDRFRRMFNEERRHEALGQTPPAAHYDPPPSSHGGRLREPDYDADHEVRRVRRNGEIKWRTTPKVNKMCYPCPRIILLPIFPIAQGEGVDGKRESAPVPPRTATRRPRWSNIST